MQLKQQILHAIETGALSRGDQLPALRSLAESLVINPNTVIRVYRELEQEGVLEIRHGIGAFVSARRITKAKSDRIETASELVTELIEKLRDLNLGEAEIRRLFEAGLVRRAVA